MKKFKCLSLLVSSILLTSCVTNVDRQYNETVAKAQKQLHSVLKSNIENEKRFSEVPDYVRQALEEYDAFGSEEGFFSIEAQSVSVETFINNLAVATDLNIVVNPNLYNKDINITLKLNNVTMPEIAEAMRENYGIEVEQRGNIYYVGAPERDTKFFRLNYLDISRKGRGQLSVDSAQLSGGVNGGTGGGSGSASQLSSDFNTNSTTFWGNIKQGISNIISEPQALEADGNKYITLNSFSGIISVKAYPHQLEQVSEYLGIVQESVQRQVIIQAKIIEVTLTNGLNTAVNLESVGFQLDSKKGEYSYSSALQLPNFAAVITLLSKFGKLSVLSDPVISTLNNQKAIIKVGSDQFFSTGSSSSFVPTNTTGNTVVSNVQLQPYFSGISLDVTPQISEDGHIMMNIHPLVSMVRQRNVHVTLSKARTLVFPTAESIIREADTMVRVKDGEIILIGGLMQNTAHLERSGLPGLGFDAAYDRTESGSKTDLIILLKPMIVKKGSWNTAIEQFAESIKDNTQEQEQQK